MIYSERNLHGCMWEESKSWSVLRQLSKKQKNSLASVKGCGRVCNVRQDFKDRENNTAVALKICPSFPKLLLTRCFPAG